MSAEIMKLIKEKEVQYVDLRFTDLRGKMQHVTFDVGMITPEIFTEGTMFDGSSISGWKAINESDMVMRPDASGAHIDPFFQQTTLALFCDILEPGTLQPYSRCPRSIAKKAEAYVKSSGAGDTAYFGPEAEFFVFDDVRWSTDPWNTGYSFDSSELPVNTNKPYEGGNMGHRPGPKGGYFPVPPINSLQDIRGEMLDVMGQIGLRPEKHHHEVAPAQHELGLKFDTLTRMADSMNLYKYIIHQVAATYGKSATFMPKPYFKDNGSGMHVHMSIWKKGANMFAGDRYADLSEIVPALYWRRHQTRQGDQRLLQLHHQFLQTAGARLRSAGVAGLFGAQSLGLVPHSARHRRERQARGSAFPRSRGQYVSDVRGAIDGGPGRHREENPPRRSAG